MKFLFKNREQEKPFFYNNPNCRRWYKYERAIISKESRKRLKTKLKEPKLKCI